MTPAIAQPWVSLHTFGVMNVNGADWDEDDFTPVNKVATIVLAPSTL
jgi:hypothetical protein